MSTSHGPRILLAKPPISVKGSHSGAGGLEDESTNFRSRLLPSAPLSLLSDSWEFQIDRFLPFLTDNTDFMVVGIVGTTGAGKSTIMNNLYCYHPSFSGMLPPFAVQSEESRAMARHCTVGIEPRISYDRIILLDSQPVFSPSLLADLMKPDGSSSVSVLSGETLSTEISHELMDIQLGVLLSSICHVLVVVSEGVHDLNMWNYMLTVDMLKHGIPEPSFQSQTGSRVSEKDRQVCQEVEDEEFFATPFFVHTRPRDEDFNGGHDLEQMKKALSHHLASSSMGRRGRRRKAQDGRESFQPCPAPELFVIPLQLKPGCAAAEDIYQHESFESAMAHLRNQVMLMSSRVGFGRPVSEREWLRSSSRIWDTVKTSPVIMDYGRALQSSRGG